MRFHQSMPESNQIQRIRIDPDGLDFETLRKEAINKVQDLCGEIWTDYNLHHSDANSKLSCLLLPKSCFLLKNRREIQTKHFPLSCSFYLYEGLLYRNAQLEIL